jgi:putative protease
MTDGRFTSVARGKQLVEKAETRAVSDDFLEEELGALGGTSLSLGSFRVDRDPGQPGIFYPHKELKEIRRELTSQLERLRSSQRVERPDGPVKTSAEALSWLSETRARRVEPAHPSTRLNVLLRDKDQVIDLVAAWKLGRIDPNLLDAVILDFEFGMDYEPGIRALREAGVRAGIATTRILKPKEYTNFTRIERCAPDVILVRNLGALHYFTKVKPFQGELRGDFSLNVTNHLTAQYLVDKGLRSVTASYDLNNRQLLDLLEASDPSRLEVTAHQYMPSFHMEHCVFAAFLSQGSSFRDCGKPCERHRVELKDQFGNRHEIKPDQECRNTMFNAIPQSAARFIDSWKQKGLGWVRYEALYERGADLIDKIQGYQDLVAGRKSAEQLVAELKLLEKYGLGEGAIARTQEYQSRKK